MNRLILAAIRCSLMFSAVTASLFSVRPAQAFTVTLKEVGSNVVATGFGAINLTGLTFVSGGFVATGSMGPSIALLTVADGTGLSQYTGFSGPSSFGPGTTIINASSDSGDSVSIIGTAVFPGPGIFLPAGYVSGAALVGQLDLQQCDLRQPRGNARQIHMDVGDWITEPELHAPDRAGPGSESSRRWFDSFSARLRFARLGCFAAQVELLRRNFLGLMLAARIADSTSGNAISFSAAPFLCGPLRDQTLRELVYRPFQFQKCSQLFVGIYNELSP
jgi:hypothetical protein